MRQDDNLLGKSDAANKRQAIPYFMAFCF